MQENGWKQQKSSVRVRLLGFARAVLGSHWGLRSVFTDVLLLAPTQKKLLSCLRNKECSKYCVSVGGGAGGGSKRRIRFQIV